MTALISLIVLAVLLGRHSGGVRWGVVAASVGGGFVLYVAALLAGRMAEVHLGCLLGLLEAVLIIGGGLWAQRLLLAGGHAPIDAQWRALAVVTGPLTLLLVAVVAVRLRSQREPRAP